MEGKPERNCWPRIGMGYEHRLSAQKARPGLTRTQRAIQHIAEWGVFAPRLAGSAILADPTREGSRRRQAKDGKFGKRGGWGEGPPRDAMRAVKAWQEQQ